METMNRRVFTAVLVSLVIVGLTLLVFLRGRERPAAPPPSGDVAASAGAAPEGAQAPGSVGGAAANVAGAKAKAEDEPPVPDPGPPLLKGRVTGEGQGIAGATVRIYATRLVEEAIDRLQDVIPQGEGGMPDVMAIISLVRDELDKLRRSGEAAKTDAAGGYEFRKVAAGGYLVLAVADGWLFRFGDVASIAAGRTQTLDLELSRGSSIAGRVVNESGAGLAGVPVAAEFRPGGIAGVGFIFRKLLRYVNGEFLRGPFETSSRPDGSFVLSSLPPGIYDLAATGEGGIETRLKGIEAGAQDAVIYLGKGGTVRGSFSEANGSPVAGVTLRIERREDLVQLPLPMAGFNEIANALNRLMGEGPRTAESKKQGEFRVGPLGAGSYKLSVEERGLLPFSRTFELDAGQSLNLGVLLLDRGGAIRGVVRREGGSPLPGARVLATPAAANFFSMGSVMADTFSGRAVATTDASGVFQLGGLGRGKYRLTATSPGFSAGVKRDVSTESDPVELVLTPGFRVTGRVTASPGGKPLSGARVQAGGAQARSGEDGRFVLDGVVPHDPSADPFSDMAGVAYRSGTEAAGKRPVTVKASLSGYLSAEESLEVGGGKGLEVEIELGVLPRVAGVVLDPEGKPAPGSLVRLCPNMKENDLPPGFDFFDRAIIFLAADVSDAEGKFRFSSFRGAGANERYQVVADHLLHARGTSKSFSISGDESGTEEIEVRLVGAARLKGVVTDGQRSVSGATVRLKKAPAEGTKGDPGSAMFLNMMGLPKGGDASYTGREGTFAYDRLAPGRYSVSAEKAEFTESPAEVVVLAAGETKEVSLVVDPGGQITGEVTDQQGDALSGARVRLFRAWGAEEKQEEQLLQAQKLFGGSYKSARADGEGSFAITGLPPGRYSLLVEHPGFTPAELKEVSPGEVPVRIALVPAAALRGRVADAGSGQPVTQFRVQVTRADSVDPLQGFDPRWMGRDFHDAEGRFVRDDLESGKYEVKVVASGYASAKKEVFLSPGTAVEDTFLLAQAGRIRGTVVDRLTGAPLSGAKVSLGRMVESGKGRQEGEAEKEQARTGGQGDPHQEDARAVGEHFSREWMGEETAISGEDGSFLLEGVPEGPQTVVVSHADYIPESREKLEVALGQEIEAAFTLRPGFSISGKVLDAQGTAAQGKMVFARGTGEENSHVRKSGLSGPGGEFAVRGLEAGPYRIYLPESIRVEPGKVDAQIRPSVLEIDVQGNQRGLEVRVPEKTDREE
jgi:hypothetical protein